MPKLIDRLAAKINPKVLLFLGFLGVIVFSIGAELIYIALSEIIVFNISLSDATRNLYFSSGSILLVAGLWIINEFRKPEKSDKMMNAVITLGGFLLIAFSLYWLLNCVNALWYFSFRTDHSTQTVIFYAYQNFYWDGFFALGLGIWLLIKGKQYQQLRNVVNASDAKT
jgi:hypothetical protein